MADNTTPLGFISYPDKGDTSWYSSDASGDGLTDWLAAIELFGIPTYQSFADLPTAGSTETDGNQRQFAAVIDDQTVYRDDGSSWVVWLGSGTSARTRSGTTYLDTVETNAIADDGTDAITLDGNANVTIPAGSLLVGGNGVEDTDSDTRLAFFLDETSVYGGDGTTGSAVTVNSDTEEVKLSASENSNATVVFENQGQAENQITYFPGGGDGLGNSLPGTLQFDAADIDLVDGAIQDSGTDTITVDGSQNITLPNGHAETSGGVEYQQRGDPTTSELSDGQCMEYCSDGSGTGSAGDLVYAVNDSGTIKTSIIAQRSNAT